MPLPGWRRKRGKGPRRYVDPKGRTQTEYAYRNARAKASGWKSYYDYRKTSSKDRYYNQARTDAIIERQLSKRQTGMTSQFSRLFTRQRKAYQIDSDAWHDPDGPMADFLVYIKRREEDEEYPVGETPQLNRR